MQIVRCGRWLRGACGCCGNTRCGSFGSSSFRSYSFLGCGFLGRGPLNHNRGLFRGGFLFCCRSRRLCFRFFSLGGRSCARCFGSGGFFCSTLNRSGLFTPHSVNPKTGDSGGCLHCTILARPLHSRGSGAALRRRMRHAAPHYHMKPQARRRAPHTKTREREKPKKERQLSSHLALSQLQKEQQK